MCGISKAQEDNNTGPRSRTQIRIQQVFINHLKNIHTRQNQVNNISYKDFEEFNSNI
jgi:hypothetical protein